MNLILAQAGNSDGANREGGDKFNSNAKCESLHAGGERVNGQEDALCYRRGLTTAAQETIRVQPANWMMLRRLVPCDDQAGGSTRPANCTWQLRIREL
jgi:cytochrome P450